MENLLKKKRKFWILRKKISTPNTKAMKLMEIQLLLAHPIYKINQLLLSLAHMEMQPERKPSLKLIEAQFRK